MDDRGLYAHGQVWLQRKDVVGRARGFVPYIGIVTIIMNEYPELKVRLHENNGSDLWGWLFFINAYFLLFAVRCLSAINFSYYIYTMSSYVQGMYY